MTFFQELIRSAGKSPASPLGPKPTDPTEIKARENEASRLTRLLLNNRSFSYVRLGDMDLALLLTAQENKQSPEFTAKQETTSGTQPAGAPGLSTKFARRLLEAVERADYIDLYERIWPVSSLLSRLKRKPKDGQTHNPNPETSLIILSWLEKEFCGFCENRRVGFVGAEAGVLRYLSRRPEFLEAACDVWPSRGQQFFHQPRNNGDKLEANLDLIKQDLKAFVQENQIDTLFLSLGAGAKILAHELAQEDKVRCVDFGAMLRALCHLGTDGNRVGRSTHHPFLYSLDFDLVMDAVEAAYPDLKPEQLLAKAHAQVILEIQKRERGWTFSSKELTLDQDSKKRLRSSYKKYKIRYQNLFDANPQTKLERKNFLHFCGSHGLTWEGRLFLAWFHAKGILAILLRRGGV